MKLRDILLTASSNMVRSKLRSILTIVAIFVGSLTLALTTGLGAGISQYVDKQLGNLGADNALLVQPKTDSNPASGPRKYNPDQTLRGSGRFVQPVLNRKDLQTIKDYPGIQSVDANIDVAVEYVIGPNTEKYLLTATTYIDGSNLDIAQGRTISNQDTTPSLVLPISYVPVLGFANPTDAVGKSITLAIRNTFGTVREVSATIVGVQQQTLISSAGAQINATLAKQLYSLQTEGIPGSFSEQYFSATARVHEGTSEQDMERIKTGLAQKGYTALTIKDGIGTLKNVIRAITVVLNCFAAIALLAASFGVINTLLMAVQERTKEIGLMKAMGMSSNRIFMLFSTEAILLGFWGSLLGVGVANALGRLANRWANQSFLKELPSFTLMSFPLRPMVQIILIVMAVAFLAGTLPARRAAKQNPIDALRYE